MFHIPLWDHPLPIIQWGVVIVTALVAAACDLRSRRIPNILTGPALLAGIIWGSCLGGFGGLVDSLGGMVCAVLPFIVMFLFGGGGGGDAKLMAAIGAWLGIIQGITAMIAVVFAGALLAIGYAIFYKRGTQTFENLVVMGLSFVSFLKGGFKGHQGQLGTQCGVTAPGVSQMLVMPYGPAIFVGVSMACGVTFLWHLWQ